MFMDEGKLVRKLSRGDSHSFDVIYYKYVSTLYHFVYQWVKSDQIASEIVQDTFVKLWIRREGLDPNKSVKSYLFTISYHKIIKELRRQVRNPLMKDYIYVLETLSSEPHPDYDFDHYIAMLKKIKAELPLRQRQIFELAKEEGFSAKEIAAQLGIQEQVVRNQLSAALKRIREYIIQSR